MMCYMTTLVMSGNLSGMALGANASRRTPLSAAIGLVIHEQRRARGMTQGELAAAIGSDPKTISQIERHERVADSSQIWLIADALGIDSSEIWILAQRRLSA